MHHARPGTYRGAQPNPMNGPYLPPRREGNHHDTVTMRCLDGDAGTAYARARERFFAVAGWHQLNPNFRTRFQLCEAGGTVVRRHPRRGDLIRVDLAGPGSPSGGGYDWVAVTQIEEWEGEWPFVALTLVPAPAPGAPTDTVAHFYAAGATNTLVLRRAGDCLLAEAHGRNERPNVHRVPLGDRLRNGAVAVAGKVGIGQVQWQDWTDGLLSVIEPEPER